MKHVYFYSLLILLNIMDLENVNIGSDALRYLEQYNLPGDPSLSTYSDNPNNITLQNMVVENNQSDSYIANSNITIAGGGTTFVAEDGSYLYLHSGNEINLNAGFKIQQGATLIIDQ
jgi:hypothetical protein